MRRVYPIVRDLLNFLPVWVRRRLPVPAGKPMGPGYVDALDPRLPWTVLDRPRGRVHQRATHEDAALLVERLHPEIPIAYPGQAGGLRTSARVCPIVPTDCLLADDSGP